MKNNIPTNFVYILNSKEEFCNFINTIKKADSFSEQIIRCDMASFNKVSIQDLPNRLKYLDKNNYLIIPYKHKFTTNKSLLNKTRWTLTPWEIIKKKDGYIKFSSIFALEDKPFHKTDKKKSGKLIYDYFFLLKFKDLLGDINVPILTYKDSYIRKYLTSNFLNNFNKDLIKIIEKTKIKEDNQITEDLFYIPSISELCPKTYHLSYDHRKWRDYRIESIKPQLEYVIYSNTLLQDTVQKLEDKKECCLTRTKCSKEYFKSTGDDGVVERGSYRYCLIRSNHKVLRNSIFNNKTGRNEHETQLCECSSSNVLETMPISPLFRMKIKD